MLVQGNSMLPNYHNWQFTIIDKRQTQTYTSGDVIAFYCPNLDAILVKRIAAVAGDTVHIQHGTLLVNDIPPTFLPSNTTIAYAGIAEEKTTVPSKQYFVLGDNVSESKDSRYEMISFIEESNILGKVIPQTSSVK